MPVSDNNKKPLVDSVLKLPYYAKATLVLIGLYVTISILSIGQNIILPLIYATIIAVLLSNIVNFLVRKRINRVLAIILTLILTIAFVGGLCTVLVSQAVRLSDSFPVLMDKLLLLVNQLTAWISGSFNIRQNDMDVWVNNAKTDLIHNSSALIGNSLTTLGSLLVVIFLIPVYIFMILFYKPLLVEFVHKLFASVNFEIDELLTETKSIIQSYLTGLLIEATIVAALNSIGLLILGIDYAIILGILGAILNFIPYLGGLIGVLIYMMVALLTKDPSYMLYVFLAYTFIQFVDNHYIVPKIVGSKVKINALVSIVAVISGGILWGIPGMFLSIPLTAIIKLIFDRIDSLKPWGFLLGDNMPQITKVRLDFIKKRLKK